MKVIQGGFRNAQEGPERTPLKEAIVSALDSLEVADATRGAFLLAVELDDGIRICTNETIGDTLLTMKIVEATLVGQYLSTKNEEG